MIKQLCLYFGTGKAGASFIRSRRLMLKYPIDSSLTLSKNRAEGLMYFMNLLVSPT